MSAHSSAAHSIAIIGGGPAGLFAAELLSAAGRAVDLYDRMPSVGRKLLLAGRGGLNLTHSEDLGAFATRYGAAAEFMAPLLAAFGPADLRAWAAGLGIATFVGTSGRVFPSDFKAAPLLRAWVARLRRQGVRFHLRHRWLGWDGSALLFDHEGIQRRIEPDATLLALGGASWSRMGSDGAWWPWLAQRGIGLAPLRPANCGFDLPWSPLFRERWAGQAIKAVTVRHGTQAVRGEIMPTDYGLEGSPIYALSASLREALAVGAPAELRLDLKPDVALADLTARLAAQPPALSLSNRLKRATKLDPAAIALLREAGPLPGDAAGLAARIKDLPLTVTAPRPLEEAISTAGGIRLDQLTDGLMLTSQPGLFACGEMLDWEAPTGGYLLQGCFSTAYRAVAGILAYAPIAKSTSTPQ